MKAGFRAAALAAGAVLCAGSLLSASAGDLKRLYDPVVARISQKHAVPAALIHAVIQAESNYDRFAISDKGAMGLMQLMPSTAARYGVMNVFDPDQNIEGGAKYLKDLIRLYGRRTDYVLAAYNAGQEAVRRYSGVPPYQETRDYIRRVQAAYPKPLVRKPIYKFVDASGRTVLTDDPDYDLGKKTPSSGR
jgi:soluble lytic murein transglycosylase-like protein